LADWAVVASWWLEGPCKEGGAILGGNNWCGGADMNFNSYIDSEDLLLFASCWLNRDTEAPTPNPAVWLVEPAGTGMTTVSMEAMQARDKWGGVEYYFEAIRIADSQLHNSGWRQSFDPSRAGYIYSLTDPTVRAWIFKDTGLTAGVEYLYTVKARDIAGNETLPSVQRSATPGEDNTAPTPNPALWETVPYQNGASTIRMVAQVAADAEGNGVSYSFICAEDASLNSGWIAGNEYVTPAVLVLGQTYTFSVRYRDNSINLNVTDTSALVAVTIGAVDSDPPTPDPTTLAVTWWQQGSTWYHILVAGEVTDATQITYNGVVYDGVEYQFRCVDLPGLVAGTWYNVTNVFAEAYPPNSAYYPDLQTLKVPNIIWVYVGSGMTDHTYQVRTRDMSPNQNMSVNWSPEVTSP
jgi:hypothetical protein